MDSNWQENYAKEQARIAREGAAVLRQSMKDEDIALVVATYSGGNDEGSIEEIRGFTLAEVEANPVLADFSYHDDYGWDLGKELEGWDDWTDPRHTALEMILGEYEGSFAGDYEVNGALLVRLEGDQVRHKVNRSVGTTQYEDDNTAWV